MFVNPNFAFSNPSLPRPLLAFPFLVPLTLPQGVGVLVQRAPDELRLLPQVGRQEAVGVGDGGEGGLQGVLESLGRTGRGRVGVLDTGEL